MKTGEMIFTANSVSMALKFGIHVLFSLEYFPMQFMYE